MSLGEVMWHYAQGGAQQGPVPHGELCALFASTELPLDTHVWRPGMPDWAEASTIDEFRGVYGKGFGPRAADPPPLPANAQGRLTLDPVAPVAGPAIPLAPAHPRASIACELERAERHDAHWNDLPYARPWVRFWARSFDMNLVLLVVVWVSRPWLAGREPTPLDHIVLGVTTLLVTIPACALQLWLFGTTAGKALFRTSVLTEGGRRPTLGEALGRELRVFVFGQALFLPLFNFFANLTAWSTLQADGVTSWDRVLGLAVRHRRMGLHRWALWPVACVVIQVGQVMAMLPVDYSDAGARLASRAGLGSGGGIAISPVSPDPTTQPAPAPGGTGRRPRVLTVPTAPNEYSTEKVIIKPVAPTSRPARPARPQRVAATPPAD